MDALWLGSLLGSWMVVFLSAVVANLPRVNARVLRFHVALMLLPVAVSLAGVVAAPPEVAAGAWRADALGWFFALYVSVLSAAIQRFSLRYLQGDIAYRRYFLFLVITTGASCLTWISDDMRAFALSWAVMAFGLVALVALKREWSPVAAVATRMAVTFAVGVLACAAALGYLAGATGTWRLSEALARTAALGAGETAGLGILFAVAALILAGQWPFQRWLLESAVTPTPVSAVMHAGIVNAGGLLLARVSPLFDAAGSGVHLLLLGAAWLSVLLGTGIALVHVDYKRQLVASTMAQMGLMLVQCAVGAYDAALVHIVLHGLFKATLFLRSGSVVPHPATRFVPAGVPSRRHLALGAALGVLLGGAYWAEAPGEPARLLSALFLGASVALAWGQLPAFREGRWMGLAALAVLAVLAEGVRATLSAYLRAALPHGPQPDLAAAVLAASLFALSAAVLALVTRCPGTPLYARLYLCFVHLGEPRPAAMDRHPRYLATYGEEVGLR